MADKKLAIVIIEDEECVRESLTWFMEDLGHVVSSGEVPSDCDLFKGKSCTRSSSCFDVMIIDHHLPGLIGLEFIEHLQENGCKGLMSHILLASGDSTSINQKKAEQLGITVVQKPMSFSFLETWLDNIAP